MVEINSSYIIDAYYGDSSTPCLVFVCEMDDETWWYCVEGSQNTNLSDVEPTYNCNVEDLNDIECFEGKYFHNLTDFTNEIRDHNTPVLETAVHLTLEIDSSNAAFQDGNSEAELIRILKNVIDKIEGKDFVDSKLKDSNGNNVGNLYYIVEED